MQTAILRHFQIVDANAHTIFDKTLFIIYHNLYNGFEYYTQGRTCRMYRCLYIAGGFKDNYDINGTFTKYTNCTLGDCGAATATYKKTNKTLYYWYAIFYRDDSAILSNSPNYNTYGQDEYIKYIVPIHELGHGFTNNAHCNHSGYGADECALHSPSQCPISGDGITSEKAKRYCYGHQDEIINYIPTWEKKICY